MPKITQPNKAKNMSSKRVLGDSFIARKRAILLHLKLSNPYNMEKLSY